MNKSYGYLTNCVQSGDGAAIRDMVEQATDISRRTFLKYVDTVELQNIEYRLGYEVRFPRRGLTMARDWHVSYHPQHVQGPALRVLPLVCH